MPIAMATLVVVLVVGVGLYAYKVLEPVSRVTSQTVPTTNSEEDYLRKLCEQYACSRGVSPNSSITKSSTAIINVPELRRDQRINILLLASDDDRKYKDQGNKFPATQVMLVLSLDPLHNTASLLSIPRDLWVPVQGNGNHKIDEASLVGGVALARETIEENFGIAISRYAWLGLSGFVQVIDAVGGVDVDSQFPILDDDYPNDLESPNNPYASRRLYIPAGPQHLDGVATLEFVRSRHGTLMQDFARSLHQQQVLVDIKRKVVWTTDHHPAAPTRRLDQSEYRQHRLEHI